MAGTRERRDRLICCLPLPKLQSHAVCCDVLVRGVQTVLVNCTKSEKN